jgi:aspartyl protease family protein
LEKYLFIGGLMIVSAIVTPQLLDRQLDNAEQVNSAPVETVSTQTNDVVKKRNPLDGRKTIIPMDSRGHFIVDARMNGYKAKVLVDTGATYVAINETTARKLGIRLKESDFKHKVRTANGITMAASGMIDEIQIGRVRVQNVRASISRDEALSVVLLGMAFLKKLDKFEITGNELILTQ